MCFLHCLKELSYYYKICEEKLNNLLKRKIFDFKKNNIVMGINRGGGDYFIIGIKAII